MTTQQPSTSPHVVLIVDDNPDSLSMLHDALDSAGYMVLVAADGNTALQRARHGQPSVILLDAVMPNMDGFEVCRRLKSDFITQHIPVIFMTGLTDTENVVAAFGAGGVDYVTKPIKPTEVMVRIASHIQQAQISAQARVALDAFGQATIAVRPGQRAILWQTPLARQLLAQYFEGLTFHLPDDVYFWLNQYAAGDQQGDYICLQPDRRLIVSVVSQTGDGEWLLILREMSDTAQYARLKQHFQLTLREAQVVYWVAQGKTSPDIGDILQISPRTVNKHLEHVFEKLAVETRTAAVAKVREVIW